MKLSVLKLSISNKKSEFAYRADSISDKGVISQIFKNQNYNIVGWTQGKKLWEYHVEQSKKRPSLIVDAGANIGASVVYFLNMFDNSFVFSIEPEKENGRLLETNTASYPNKINFHGAISDCDGDLALVDPGLSDWGFRTASVEEIPPEKRIIVPGISPQTILSHPKVAHTTPLIFKVDIEGGESRLFDGDTSWMNKFPLIIIELHDWLLPFSGSSRSFLRAVARYDFDFVYRGENIFLFNRSILAPETGAQRKPKKERGRKGSS